MWTCCSCGHFKAATDILTCHTMKSTGVTDNINDGSVPIKYPSEPQWCDSFHNTRTLKLKQLNGIHPWFIFFFLCFSCSDMSKCLLWNGSVALIDEPTEDYLCCSHLSANNFTVLFHSHRSLQCCFQQQLYNLTVPYLLSSKQTSWWT